MKKITMFFSMLLGVTLAVAGVGQDLSGQSSRLTVKQIMNALVTPATNTIWGAYQLQTDAEWQDVENAALTVIAAGELLADGEQQAAREAAWQGFNQQMVSAARQVLSAVAQRDEEALSAAGNDALYPPCESCHQQYQTR